MGIGIAFTDWSQATGAMYIGAGGSGPAFWTAVAFGLCVLALVIGRSRQL